MIHSVYYPVIEKVNFKLIRALDEDWLFESRPWLLKVIETLVYKAQALTPILLQVFSGLMGRLQGQGLSDEEQNTLAVLVSHAPEYLLNNENVCTTLQA